MKRCSRCGREKLLSGFYENGVNPNGSTRYRGECKLCSTSRVRVRRQANPARAAAAQRAWRKKNPEAYRAQRKRYRAKRREAA